MFNLERQVSSSQNALLPALLNLLRDNECFVLLDNTYTSTAGVVAEKTFDLLVGIKGDGNMLPQSLEEINDLIEFAKTNQQFIFGHLCYGLKDQIEKLNSRHHDTFERSLMHFFIPEAVIRISGNTIFISGETEASCETIYRNLVDSSSEINTYSAKDKIEDYSPSISQKTYLDKIDAIQRHIQRGDIYEMNYCMELKKENISIDPFSVYHTLTNQSPAPFSCFYRDSNNYLLCSSPERFIQRKGNKIISQPIKGTARRGKNFTEDEKIKTELFQNEKERSENVMIVDLVRNDLSRIAKRSTVKVDELFGIYSFPAVHQMISTISAEVKDDVTFSQIIKALFPMGSMTGAPKIRAMQLIDEFEDFNRGIYSGSIGYIAPNGDFDFNVVIRSIIYNDEKKLLSIPVGGAITVASVGQSEYEECLLKAQSLLKSLGLSSLSDELK